MDKRFLVILAAITVGLAGVFVIAKQSGDDKNGSGGSSSSAQPTNHKSGQGEAGVTFTEYGDFQCPVCAIYFEPVKQATAKYSKEVFFQFRNLPLVNIHQNAFAAARAAEAAGKQDKFWEMHDKLYENQTTWASSSNALNFFKTYAKAIGLDMAKFEKDYASAEINDAINADLAEFEKTGRDMATPTFFINGKYVANNDLSDPSTGIPSAELISAQLEKAIAEQTSVSN